jgi:hypothetical protein
MRTKKLEHLQLRPLTLRDLQANPIKFNGKEATAPKHTLQNQRTLLTQN